MSPSIKVATFNVSMEADNYRTEPEAVADPRALQRHLASGRHPQIRNIAEIIQRVRPDILLLNEFDYIADPKRGVLAFQRHYLQQGQGGAAPIHFPYHYLAPVNSGVPSPYDFDGDGVASGTGGDAWGFGRYPGQYGMVLLSRFPILQEQVRTFAKFPWHRLAAPQKITRADGRDFYDASTWRALRLSSKSHWDVPVQIGEHRLHLLAAHPTPPVFDGPEGRNGARNFDEIRLWAEYIDNAPYLVDDQDRQGGLPPNRRFVILGDYNASATEGRSRPGAIEQLLHHSRINAKWVPISQGGAAHSPDNPHGASHTASWRARVDYVLPSRWGLEVRDGGVFWPAPDSPLHPLVVNRRASSDHRLVWQTLKLTHGPEGNESGT
ncbi:endonuclease/exonuclease/phosphatase family protein [Ferrimonas gelatinilytica]|uniref:Endonuclease/exonuclease/phosphatase family protein n=1 Tax=Ferrimonas gelatinilytica TaxID=1255257 RepID=A0ABP9RZZ0_9GAMM